MAHRPTVDEFLREFPEDVRILSERLRILVRQTIPDIVEAVYPGWRVIGYRVPVGKKTHYVGFIAPFPDRSLLGFDNGSLLTDSHGLLKGERLKQVRYLELGPKWPSS